MSAKKFKMTNIRPTDDEIPLLSSNEDNKALNKILNYVYDDEFVLMINELSTSILNYDKIISKCFINIRILLNKIGESSYQTAIEGNCSNLENSFKKFYSNAKIIFRKMKLYRNEKFKNINDSTPLHNLNLKNADKKNGLTIIINNNNNNNNINDNKHITEYSRSPQEKNAKNFFTNFNTNNEENDKNYFLQKKIFDFFEQLKHILISEKNEKLVQIKSKEDYYLNKNYVINKNNNTKIDFYEYIKNNEKKIFTKINFLIESKNKVFNDIESLIEKSQKEKKEYKNQINALKTRIEFMDKNDKNIIDLKNKIIEYDKKIENKENELKLEKNKYKDIMEQKINLNNIIKENTKEIFELKEENKNLNQKITELSEYKDKYLIEINDKEEIKNIKNKFLNDIEKYKIDILNLKNQNKHISKEIITKQNQIEILEENNKKLTEEFNKKISALKNENNNLIKENKIKENEISLLNDNKKETILKLKNIEEEHQNSIKSNDELNKKILKEKEALLSQLNIQNNKLTEEYNDLNKVYKEQIKNFNEISNKYNDIKNKYKEINIKFDEANNEIKELNEELIKLKLEKEKIKYELTTKSEDYESIKEKYISLIENKSRETKNYEKNKNKILELEKEIIKKNEKLLERQNEMDKNQEEIIKYQNEINVLQNEIKEQKEEIEKIKSEFNNQNKSLNKCKELIKEEQNKNKELQKFKNEFENKNLYQQNKESKVNTIEAIRTNSIKKTMKKPNYIIQTDYKSESTNIKNIYFNSNKNTINTESNKIEEQEKNNIEIDNKTSELELTPENYIIVKCTELSSKLRWYLFKKKNKNNSKNNNMNKNAFIFTHIKSYFKNSKSYRNTLNNNTSKNPELYDATYEDFIWKPFKNQKEFARFGELPKSETKENYDTIEDLNSKIRKLEENIIEKEKEYEILYINYNILNQKNKNLEESDKLLDVIDKLKKENSRLNDLVIKYRNEKNDEVGLSFIDNDLESSKFLDDKCFEDILSTLDKKDPEKKNESNMTSKSKKINNSKSNESGNNKIRESFFNKHLKDSINLLMNQVNMNQNARSTLSSILIQLGCSDEDIYKLMGNYRGTISIAGIGNNKNTK